MIDPGEAHHGILRLSCQISGGWRKALGALQTGLCAMREDGGAWSGLLDGFTERGRGYAQLAGVRTDASVVGERHHIPPMCPETALGEGCGQQRLRKAALILRRRSRGIHERREGNILR